MDPVQVLLWILAIAILVLLVWSLVSLSHSPLSPGRRIPWAFAMFLLPVLGPAVWMWWRFHYYERRKAEQPEWDPNSNRVIVNPPRRPNSGR
ncbi:PLD nuclease N-terminal domain-containing protein [Citricoccus sp. NPDC055426]|uniref:PLD nuclease N-terminal domain-containing protein n=1 Tax=Citricoccus sp. NPDC055426 TaxID=3155536 RepID=UPI0034199065